MSLFTYPHTRPKLVIESTGGRQISRCYDITSWKITATHRLRKEKLVDLFKLGLIGIGQEFSIKSQCDGKEAPAGEDTVECVAVDRNGEKLPGPAINPWTDEPYPPAKYPYYVYECETRCDSGD